MCKDPGLVQLNANGTVTSSAPISTNQSRSQGMQSLMFENALTRGMLCNLELRDKTMQSSTPTPSYAQKPQAGKQAGQTKANGKGLGGLDAYLKPSAQSSSGECLL